MADKKATEPKASSEKATHTKTTLRKIGNSVGLIIPSEVLAEMNVEEGDDLFMVRTPEGIQLTPYDPDLAASIEGLREFMRTHRNAFRELAK